MLQLHMHSVYSYKKSTAKIEDIVAEAKKQGETSFCITDYGSLTSLVKGFAAAKKNGMKFIPGCEFLIKPEAEAYSEAVKEEINFCYKELRLKRTTEEMAKDYEKRIAHLESLQTVDHHSLVVIARNNTGFRNLVRIFNSELDEGNGFLASNESILEFNEGLTVLSGGINGEIMYWIQTGKPEKAEEVLLKYVNTFGKNFYAQLEFQFCKNPINGMTELEAMGHFIALCEKHNVPFVATNNASFVKQSDRAHFRLYCNVKTTERLVFNNDGNWMKTEDELKPLLAEKYGEALAEQAFANIKTIDASCEAIDVPKADSLINCEADLMERCVKGWEKFRLGTKREQESLDRYKYEFEVIANKNFTQYFIKVINIILLAKELGILIGPGRGSGAGSEICYLIGITAVDPLEYDLFFERFLNPERGGMPDIDIDMASVPLGNLSVNNQMGVEITQEEMSADDEDESGQSASRNLLVEELLRRGEFQFAAYIQNESRNTALTLFKALAAYHEILPSEINKISTDAVYSDKLKEKNYTGWLPQAVADFGLDWEDVWEPIHERMQFCYDLNKTPQGSSIAASGVIMADTQAILPVHNGAICFNGKDLESWDYIKFDLLSINTLNQVQYFYGLDIPWNDNDDANVWQVFADGDTDFVFQFASPGMKAILKKVKPNSIHTLAEINALYRPGPLEMGLAEKYIAVKTGQDANLTVEEQVISKLLKQEFGEKHTGLVIYQEDVMKLCQIGAGFTMTEADDVRKAMSKKDVELLAKYNEKFVQGWKWDGDPSVIWDALAGFGHYAFNKSHAVSYSIIAYQTAKIWKYERDAALEYSLNYDTNKRYSQAIAKCKELGMKFSYPTLGNMVGNKFKIENNTVYIPGEAEQNYDSYVEFLLGDTVNLSGLIFKGVCDKLTKDRYALVDLVSTLLAKPKETALYMEPQGVKYTRLTDILDGLKMCGAVVDWRKETNGIKVFVKRGRGNPSEVFFHNDSSDYVRANIIKYDMKAFGNVRPGVINDLPYINTTAIERTLSNLKERYYADGKGAYAFKAMQNKLSEYMKEYFSSKFRNTFEGVYATLQEVVVWPNSTKLILNFNDRQEILYVKGECARKVKLMPKKALVKLNLVYSPFIAKRTESFVYDFDVESIEEIKIGE